MAQPVLITAPCPLCHDAIPITQSKKEKPMIICKQCNLIHMLDNDSLCVNGDWINHPVLLVQPDGSSTISSGLCPLCRASIYHRKSNSAKNPGKLYIKCEHCDVFMFHDTTYYIKSGKSIKLH